MTLALLLDWFDVALLFVITVAAYDALRQVHPRYQPWRAVTFALICVGGGGWIAYDLHRGLVPWWSLVFHAGIASHSIIRFIARNQLGDHYVELPNRRAAVVPAAHRPQAKR